MNKWLSIALLTLIFSLFSARNSSVQAQDTLSAFQLISPSDSSFWGVSQQCQGVRQFRWQATIPSVPALIGYQVVFYASQPPSTPIWRWPSTPSNLDTFIQIPEDSLVALIGRLGGVNRQTTTLYWDVVAENDNTKLNRTAIQPYALSIWTDVDSLSSSRLVLPIDSALVDVPRLNATQLTFRWNSAFYSIPQSITTTNYQLLIDTSSNFSAPVAIFPTTDTTLVFDRAALDSLAQSAGIQNLNQPKLCYWKVIATRCTGVSSTSETQQFTLTRIDEQTQPFSILSPSFGQTWIIPENANPNFEFQWTSPIASTHTVPIQVHVLLDSLSGDFSQPWLSIPVTFSDTSLQLSAAILRQQLLNAWVGFNQPVSWKWAVSASYQNFRRLSGNSSLLILERKLDTLSRFSTVLPADSLILDVAASGTNQPTFVWQPSTHSLGETVRYRWKFWPLNGSPQAPLWSVESGNGGQLNRLTINQSQWNILLDSAGIAVNQSVEGYWAAEAVSGGISRMADSIRYLRVNRVIDSLSAFAFVSPASNAVVAIAQQTLHPVKVVWRKSANLINNPVSYLLELDTPGAAGNVPLWTTTILNDTIYNFSNTQLNALLQGLGTTIGNSRSMRLSLKAQSRGQERLADFVLNFQIQRVQDSIGAFAPLTPANATTQIVGNTLPAVVFRWSKPRSFPDSVRYTLLFDIPTGNFTSPIFERTLGTDTFLNFQSGQLDTLLAGLGVFQGQTYNLRWAVRARIGTQTRRSSIFSLNLTRFADTLSTFNLLDPVDSALLVLSSTPLTPINLRWSSSNSSNQTPVTYKCYWDIPGGNFSIPFFTKSAGSDTSLTITNFEMTTALLTLGAIPDTGIYLWTVVAESGPLALQAKNSRLVRVVWNLTTSVDEMQDPIQVFPNPAIDKVNIQANLHGSWAFSFLDLAGKVWKKGVIDFDRGIGVLPISEADSGMYFLQLCKGQTCRTVKIVKH